MAGTDREIRMTTKTLAEPGTSFAEIGRLPKLPESDVLMLSLSADGRIFMSLDSQLLRRRIFGRENELKSGIEVPKERLAELLVQARTANPKLRTVIKGDKEAEFGVAEDVMNILQKTRITRFNLITDLERPTE